MAMEVQILAWKCQNRWRVKPIHCILTLPVFNVWIFISTCSVILIQTFILSLSLHSLCKTAEVLVSLYKRHEEWEEWEEWDLGG